MSWSPTRGGSFERMDKKHDDWTDVWSPAATARTIKRVKPRVIVEAKSNLKLALALLMLDLVVCGVTAYIYYECTAPLVARSDPDRAPALVGGSLVGALLLGVVVMRVRYARQSVRKSCTGSAHWQLRQVVQPLLAIPAIFYASYVWLIYHPVHGSPTSIAFLSVLVAAKLANVYAAHKHRQTLKLHILSLEQSIVESRELDDIASEDRYDPGAPSYATDERLLAQRTLPAAAPSDAPTYRAPESPRRSRSRSRGGGRRKKSSTAKRDKKDRKQTLRGDANGAAASLTSLDDAERSMSRIDDEQPW